MRILLAALLGGASAVPAHAASILSPPAVASEAAPPLDPLGPGSLAAAIAAAPAPNADVADAEASRLPEPATWGMMFLGFGGLSFALRRRGRVGARIRFA